MTEQKPLRPLPLLAVVVVLLSAMLAGCIQGRHDSVREEHEFPPLGLGLEIPVEFPRPGPFLEGAHDMAILESFLLETGSVMLEQCGNSDAADAIEKLVATERHRLAFLGLINACSGPLNDEALAREAMQDGKESEVLDRLHWEAIEAVEVVRKALTMHSGPGSRMDAQVLRDLMNAHRGTLNQISFALGFWPAYENGTARDLLQLQGAYLGLLGAKADSRVLLTILDAYPWGDQACQVPDWGSLVLRVDAKLERAVSMADAFDASLAEGAKNPWHSDLHINVIPFLEYYVEHGWWLGLLSAEVGLEMQIAYWENLTAEAWPSFEEAQYLLALHRNESRSIGTEYVLSDFVFLFEDEFSQSIYDWHTHLNLGAAGFMGTMAVRWPYADLECP